MEWEKGLKQEELRCSRILTSNEIGRASCREIGKGKLSGYANLQPVGKFLSMGSGIIAYVCVDCGYIIKMQAEKPHVFKKK